MTQTEFRCTCGLILEKPNEENYRECVGCTTLYRTVDGILTPAREVEES